MEKTKDLPVNVRDSLVRDAKAIFAIQGASPVCSLYPKSGAVNPKKESDALTLIEAAEIDSRGLGWKDSGKVYEAVGRLVKTALADGLAEDEEANNRALGFFKTVGDNSGQGCKAYEILRRAAQEEAGTLFLASSASLLNDPDSLEDRDKTLKAAGILAAVGRYPVPYWLIGAGFALGHMEGPWKKEGKTPDSLSSLSARLFELAESVAMRNAANREE
ncbi:MAG: hypothetical protein PHF51_01870 [Candidatus ainarchaeum sp.]|nr:hypothetical protein [Candidatus ainarchaeum sp.]